MLCLAVKAVNDCKLDGSTLKTTFSISLLVHCNFPPVSWQPFVTLNMQ